MDSAVRPDFLVEERRAAWAQPGECQLQTARPRGSQYGLDQLLRPELRELFQRVKRRELSSDASNQVSLGWRRAGLPLPGLGIFCRFRFRVKQQRGEVDGRDTVDHRVVDLVHHRNATAAQPFDNCHLPQGLAEIQGSGEDTRCVVAEGSVVARTWKRGAADVIREVEVRVIDPY